MPNSKALLLVVVAVALLVTATAGTPKPLAKPVYHSVKSKVKAVRTAQLANLKKLVVRHRQAAWAWQSVMFAQRSPTNHDERRTRSLAYLQWLVKHWKRRSVAVMAKAKRPPHLREWLCIHSYEGAWNDPNAPYYGGLQMDLDFQRSYGWRLLYPKGPNGPMVTADRWTPLQQIWVAVKAYRSGRGFYPWPNTARFCGLL